MAFVASDLPPHYALDTPKEDTATGTQKPQRKQRAKTPQGNSAVRLIGGAGEGAPVTPAVMINEIIPGYVGKAKGMHNLKFCKRCFFFLFLHFFPIWIGIADVLYERGFLDPTMMDKYTLDGKKVDGVTDRSLSLRQILAGCEDFRTERTAMEDLTDRLDIEVRDSDMTLAS